jgi:hypothetical protein
MNAASIAGRISLFAWGAAPTALATQAPCFPYVECVPAVWVDTLSGGSEDKKGDGLEGA